MTPQEMKASLLQKAIQGKLVEHYPHDMVSEEVRRNALSSAENDFPFDIPDSWCWCYLEDVATLYNGRAYKKPEMLEKGKYPLLRVGNLFTSDTWYYSDLELEPEKYCDDGDLLYAWSASFGPHVWNGGKVIYHYHIWKVELRNPEMRDYLYWVLSAQTDSIKRRGHGSTMIHITKSGTEKMLIPVPPIAEQKRIVAKIEELLPYIDRYEQAWSKLEEFNKRFPVDMQKSILQMAIQGKLVEQRPEEGTGEELYHQIQVEKQALIKAGKIKKEKPLPEIAVDELPFDIPESWMWVSVGSVCTNIQYGSSQKSALSGKMAVLRMGNIQNGRIVLDKLVYTSDDEEIAKYPLQYDDLLFNRTNSKELVGKTAIYKEEIPAIYAGYLVRITPLLMSSDYLNYVMQSQFYWSYCQTVRSDAIGQSNINAEKLKRFVFPLPPLAEQKRIVAKLEEILPLCERLK